MEQESPHLKTYLTLSLKVSLKVSHFHFSGGSLVQEDVVITTWSTWSSKSASPPHSLLNLLRQKFPFGHRELPVPGVCPQLGKEMAPPGAEWGQCSATFRPVGCVAPKPWVLEQFVHPPAPCLLPLGLCMFFPQTWGEGSPAQGVCKSNSCVLFSTQELCEVWAALGQRSGNANMVLLNV